MGDPMHVYPDPNGGARSTVYAPSNIPLAGGSIAAGAAAVITAAADSGTAPDTQMFLFLQEAVRGGASGGYMTVHAADAKHVALIIFFASLSVLLQVINLVLGLRMKERLRNLSTKVCQVCKTAGLIS